MKTIALTFAAAATLLTLGACKKTAEPANDTVVSNSADANMTMPDNSAMADTNAMMSDNASNAVDAGNNGNDKKPGSN